MWLWSMFLGCQLNIRFYCPTAVLKSMVYLVKIRVPFWKLQHIDNIYDQFKTNPISVYKLNTMLSTLSIYGIQNEKESNRLSNITHPHKGVHKFI